MMENFQVLLLQTEEQRRQEREECKQEGEEWKRGTEDILSLIHI